MVTIKCKSDFKPLFYEEQAWAENKIICGIDEVGRSCLAGPVVAVAAILKPHAKHKYLKDSKELTKEQRQEAYIWLLKNSDFAVGIINHRIIDRVNIHHATLYAMKRALFQLIALNKKPDLVLVDHMALKLDNLDLLIRHFSYGESLSSSIAAASIIAKVTRDNLMARLDSTFSGYSFSSNKGYGTKAHKEAINNFGLIICHRNSFVSRLNI
jgi:ribonuclease HII